MSNESVDEAGDQDSGSTTGRLDRLGDKLLGPTAEGDHGDGPISVEGDDDTQGRRSTGRRSTGGERDIYAGE
ncbi:hypothetical protein [Streptomyces sp. NPDC026589]|uniref:hypothetical protein n=1 Tax=Streptomyces sp. NPDC026589 TaxID=3155609 RepID=UPI0033D1C6F9